MLNFLKPRNWGIVKVYRDFENYMDWRRVIRKEEANPKSKYRKWKLQRTKLFDVYVITSLDETDAGLPETIQRVKLMEILNPLHKYFDEELGFAECLNCEFNQFEDDDHNLALSFLNVYRFRFNKFSIKWLVKFIFWTILIIFLSLRFLLPWISTLI